MTVVAEPYTNTVMDSLTLLAACLCEQITESGLPDTCFCGVIPGDQVVAGYAGNCNQKCGMAWVRLTGAYPSTGVGIVNDSLRNCSSGLGIAVEVGTLRCAHVGTAEKMPTASEQMQDVQLQVADMLAMRRAVACCQGTDDWVLGQYAPMGPQGGLVGGVWTVSLWTP